MRVSLFGVYLRASDSWKLPYATIKVKARRRYSDSGYTSRIGRRADLPITDPCPLDSRMSPHATNTSAQV